jgi:cell division protein FtsL
MAGNKKKKIVLYTFFVVVIIGVSYILFNEYGLLKYSKIKGELESINMQIETLKEENVRLQNEIDSLKNKIPAKIERTAREEYDMMRENEVKIDVNEK